MYGLAAYEKRNLVHGKLDTIVYCYQDEVSKRITQASLCAPVLLPAKHTASVQRDREALCQVLDLADPRQPGYAFDVQAQLLAGWTLQDCFWQGKLPAYDWHFTMSSASFVSSYKFQLPTAAVPYKSYLMMLEPHVSRVVANTLFLVLQTHSLCLEGFDNRTLWKKVFDPVRQHGGLRAILAVRGCTQLLDPHVHGFENSSEAVVVHIQPTWEWLQQQVEMYVPTIQPFNARVSRTPNIGI
jgi:hypothetical protein